MKPSVRILINSINHFKDNFSQGVVRLEKKLKVYLNRERRLLKIILILIATFFICWAPFWIAYLTSPMYDNAFIDNPDLHLALQWLGYSNSLFNPIIYTAFNRDIRAAVVELLKASKKKLFILFDIS